MPNPRYRETIEPHAAVELDRSTLIADAAGPGPSARFIDSVTATKPSIAIKYRMKAT